MKNVFATNFSSSYELPTKHILFLPILIKLLVKSVF